MGYVHDTQMAQFIPPTLMHPVAATNISFTAGSVSGTIAMHKAASAETLVVNIPITLPQNAAALKGGYVKTIELDYEITVLAATSVTAALNKVTRGADTSGLTVSSVTITQDLTAATTAATAAKHKLTITLTTPIWLLNTEYLLLKMSFVCPATTVLDILSAVVNYTLRA